MDDFLFEILEKKLTEFEKRIDKRVKTKRGARRILLRGRN
jgi:hypothetical protein